LLATQDKVSAGKITVQFVATQDKTDFTNATQLNYSITSYPDPIRITPKS